MIRQNEHVHTVYHSLTKDGNKQALNNKRVHMYGRWTPYGCANTLEEPTYSNAGTVNLA